MSDTAKVYQQGVSTLYDGDGTAQVAQQQISTLIDGATPIQVYQVHLSVLRSIESVTSRRTTRRVRSV